MARLRESPSFSEFSFLTLNEDGRFVDGKTVVKTSGLKHYFAKHMAIAPETTDVFIWVHGWRNDSKSAMSAARTLFPGILKGHGTNSQLYPKIKKFVPTFVAVHWPSMSSIFSAGYDRIRDRAAAMTEKGEAEYFLSQLLGYLDSDNEKPASDGRKLLASRGGHFIHCVGHSFGGRFLTAAINSSAHPVPATKKLSGNLPGWPFTVDSLCVLQMAVPSRGFHKQFTRLADDAPITEGNGRIVLSWSSHDSANCLWHVAREVECGVGCSGAEEPSECISGTKLHAATQPYAGSNFRTRIVNVDASDVFTKGRILNGGAHGDIWHDETIHLLLTLAERARK